MSPNVHCCWCPAQAAATRWQNIDYDDDVNVGDDDDENDEYDGYDVSSAVDMHKLVARGGGILRISDMAPTLLDI